MKSLHRLAWGFVDQGFSSATNLGLSLLAGRLLGPAGLGSIFVGFTVYLGVLTLQRALVTDPLVVTSTTLPPDERKRRADTALTVVLVAGAAVALAMAVGGLLASGAAASGLLVVAPWILPAAVQDLWRAVLFRDGRARAAAVNDGIWLATMAAALPLLLAYRSLWMVAAIWGFGAVTSTAAGFLQTRSRPARPGASLRWWRTEASKLGKWLGATGVVYSVGAQAQVFIVAGLLGSAALGGLRATLVVFGPLSLIGPALALPGLPLVTEALEQSLHRARRIALGLAAVATVITAFYTAVFVTQPTLLSDIFGDSFTGFQSLILPVALTQIVIATTIGFPLLLRAEGRGKTLFWTRSVYVVLGVTASIVLAATSDVTTVAWGGLGVAVIGGALIGIATLSSHSQAEESNAPPSSALDRLIGV